MGMHLSWLYSLGKSGWQATYTKLTCYMKEDFGTVPPTGEIKFYYWVVKYKQIPNPRHLVHKSWKDWKQMNSQISTYQY